MTSEDFFTTIQKHYNSKLPFVVYRKPNEIKVKTLLQNKDSIYKTEDFSECGFVFSPFNDEDASILIPLEFSNFINTEYKVNSINDSSKLDFLEDSISKQNHIRLIHKGVEAIKDNQFTKVVLSRNEEIKISEYNPLYIFEQLLNSYASALVYCWYHPKIGLWLGATPETLLKIEGNRFSTMSLAGTKVYHGSLDVAWQEKEKEEQKIVTNYIVDGLNKSIEDLYVSGTTTIKAGNLLHLHSKISGKFNFKTSNLKLLINILHPTPAVCGFPKAKAKQFILKNETYNREFYTGFLGELNIKETHIRNTSKSNVENNAYASINTVTNLFVNLRCMQLKNNTAILYVGGGITKDSIPEKEWQETVSKSLIMKNML